MAKRADIAEQAPDFMKMNLLDLIMLLDPSKTNKYTPMMVKLFNQNYTQRNLRQRDIQNLQAELREAYNLVLNNIPDEKVPIIYHFLGGFDSELIRTTVNFMEAAENKQLPGVDVSQIKGVSEIHQLMSLIKLKNISKKLQKQVFKDYEDDEWLIVRPFTAEASQKYGYGTKWCTASESYQGHFFRYSEDGKLVYCINKINGNKVAVFYRTNQEKPTELSFWDMTDERIDSIFSGLPNQILEEVKTILFVKDNFTNRQLNEQAWLTSHSIYRELEKKSEEFIGEVAVPQEARAVRLERQGVTMEEEFSEDAINTADGDW
jgi:hypothetical protein